MAATPDTGFLVIADLTGYTAYLTGSELEHAPVIAGDLLETIVGRLDPPFRLAKFEGDAGFLFVEGARQDVSRPSEEVIDWQPYDHIGWRVTVPDVGLVQSTVDLDRVDVWTRVHMRWTVNGPRPADAGVFETIEREKRAALRRLGRLLDAGAGSSDALEAGT